MNSFFCKAFASALALLVSNLVLANLAEQPHFGLGHSAARINAIAVSPDGDALFSGDSSGKIIEWSIRQRRPVAVLPNPAGGAVSKLLISPDGRHVAVLSLLGRSVAVLNSKSRRVVVEKKFELAVETAVFLDKSRLLIVDGIGRALTFDTATGGTTEWFGYKKLIADARVGSTTILDERRLLLVSQTGQAYVVDHAAESIAPPQTVNLKIDPFARTVVCGRELFAQSKEGLEVFNAKTFAKSNTFAVSSDDSTMPKPVCLNSDGKIAFATAGGLSTLARGGRAIATVASSKTSAVASGGRGDIAYASDGELRYVDPHGSVSALAGWGEQVRAVSNLSRTGDLFAVAIDNVGLQLISLRTGDYKFCEIKEKFSSIEISSAGDSVFLGIAPDILRVIRSTDCRSTDARRIAGEIWGLSTSGDGKWLSVSGKKTVSLFEAADRLGQQVLIGDGGESGGSNVRFDALSNDFSVHGVVASTFDLYGFEGETEVLVTDATSGVASKARLARPPGKVLSVNVAPGYVEDVARMGFSLLVVSGSFGGSTARLWSMDTQKVLDERSLAKPDFLTSYQAMALANRNGFLITPGTEGALYDIVSTDSLAVRKSGPKRVSVQGFSRPTLVLNGEKVVFAADSGGALLLLSLDRGTVQCRISPLSGGGVLVQSPTSVFVAADGQRKSVGATDARAKLGNSNNKAALAECVAK